MEIKKGDRFICRKSFVLGGTLYFTESEVYSSSKDGFLINNEGELHEVKSKLFIDNHFERQDKLSEYVMEKSIAIENNTINPKHYSFNIKGTPCDLFDIGNAMDLNKEQFTALRYFRKKENQIEDTKKAIKCLERLVERLESQQND